MKNENKDLQNNSVKDISKENNLTNSKDIKNLMKLNNNLNILILKLDKINYISIQLNTHFYRSNNLYLQWLHNNLEPYNQ